MCRAKEEFNDHCNKIKIRRRIMRLRRIRPTGPFQRLRGGNVWLFSEMDHVTEKLDRAHWMCR